MLRAPATCKLSRTSAATSVSPLVSEKLVLPTRGPPVPGRQPGHLSSGDAPPSGQTCTASRLPAGVADAAEMYQAGAAVADRSAIVVQYQEFKRTFVSRPNEVNMNTSTRISICLSVPGGVGK